jgi:hypothetical protein
MASPKISRDSLIDAVNHERDGLRTEAYRVSEGHAPCLPVVRGGGWRAESIYFGLPEKDLSSRITIIFLLSQVEVYLMVFGVTMIAAQSMHAGYIAALERQLNEISGATISIWESEVVPQFMGSPEECSSGRTQVWGRL